MREFNIRTVIVRTALLATVAAIVPAPALAETAPETSAAPQREYLPGNIVVTGERDSYASDDGSSGTKTPTPIIDVPQAVTTITSDQLEDQGVTALNDALRFVPGVSLETGEGHRDEVFIRGQETTADFYLDGLRDDAQYYRSLYNVERVEVLKGANALIFGRGAGGGAINRVSRVAIFDMPQVNGSAQLDTFGAFALTADANIPAAEGVAVRLMGTYEEFNNHRDVYDGRFFGFTPTLSAQLGPDTRFFATYTYDDDERVVDRGLPSINGGPLQGYDETFFGDADYNLSDIEVHIGRARLEHDFSDGWSLNASLQYADYDKFYSNIVPGGGTTATTVNLSGYESGTDRVNVIVQANIVGQFETGSLGHTLLIGAEATTSETDSVRDRVLFNNGTATSVTVNLADTIAVPAFTLAPQRASASELSTVSLYAQEQLDIGILQLVAGVRYDRFDLESTDFIASFSGARVDEKVSPRFGVILKPQDNLSIYASYAESFLPSAGDQFTVLSQQDQGLEPESFENLELGLKWAPHRELLLTAAVFRLTRSNTPSVDPTTNLTTLVGESTVEGFELGLVGEPVDGLSVSLGYTYLDAEITDSADATDIGTVLQQVPEHQVTAWARYDVTDRLGFGAGVIHQSDQFASNSNNVVLPAYTRVDAAIFFEATDTLSLQVNVENLFDEDYYPSAHGDNNIQPGAPLNASVGARLRF
ncbi:TonB-dependent siderophore receptor [Aurantiacibacter sp. MUD11]|uniref:TonB-dependent receptor n=1 Tax=Aurantiacibacter sp. MUD11 TaxID=3003265 RepID=UPI0022AA0CFF|nr:TonB-dependent siderophore receptor [Aurantiacibacter sp. MUD11]WAT19216.1 TonB-dependent siderophore receptor [Aurantiacibacter sp. MUD11]